MKMSIIWNSWKEKTSVLFEKLLFEKIICFNKIKISKNKNDF